MSNEFEEFFKFCGAGEYMNFICVRAIITSLFVTYRLYRVSGHNGQVFDGNFVRLRERCVKTEVM